MTTLSELYCPRLGLLTDLYQLTMAQGYWKLGLHEREAVFHLHLGGVRLDSGELGDLARRARTILDEGGFPDAAIVASNDLDEHRIAALKAGGAPIGVWGVGTRLATAHDQPALGGVYKLAAVQDADGAWQPRIKRSEDPIKVSDPGVLQVRRWSDAAGAPLVDVLWDTLLGPPASPPAGLPADAVAEDLLQPVFVRGVRVGGAHDLAGARRRARTGWAAAAARGTPARVLREEKLARTRARLLAAAGEES